MQSSPWRGLLCVAVSGTLVALGALTITGSIPTLGRADPSMVPPPQRAVLRSPMGGVANGAWVRTPGSHVWVTTPDQAPTRYRVEIQIAAVDTTGITATKLTSSIVDTTARPSAHQVAVPLPALAGGVAYRWQARIAAEDGATGPWAGSGRFRVADAAPPPPRLVATNTVPGGWSSVPIPQFRWRVSGSQAPIARYVVAIAPAGKNSVPTWREVRTSDLSLPDLADGPWRLSVQAIDTTGVRSPVTSTTFALARSVPAPRIAAAVPTSGGVTNLQAPTIRLSGRRGAAPLQAYEYRVMPAVSDVQSDEVWTSTDASTIVLSGLADGSWHVQLRSVDMAGNHSPAIPWTFTLDRRPLELRVLPPSTLRFTAPVEQARVSYTLSKSATVTYSVMRASDQRVVRAGSLGHQDAGTSRTLLWDGKTQLGKFAAAGTYVVKIRAVDPTGNIASQGSSRITLEDRWIHVSLRTQILTAYQGTRLVLTTPVTTGGAWTPTLPGTFHVL